jgi:hypothetical protein
VLHDQEQHSTLEQQMIKETEQEAAEAEAPEEQEAHEEAPEEQERSLSMDSDECAQQGETNSSNQLHVS